MTTTLQDQLKEKVSNYKGQLTDNIELTKEAIIAHVRCYRVHAELPPQIMCNPPAAVAVPQTLEEVRDLDKRLEYLEKELKQLEDKYKGE